MYSMLLVVSSIVSADNSTDTTSAAPLPAEISALIRVRDQVQIGMTMHELHRLLGQPDVELIRGEVGQWRFLEYQKAKVRLVLEYGRVTSKY